MAKRATFGKTVALEEESPGLGAMVKKSPVGRAGPGKSTRTPGGLLRKTIYLAEGEWQALRRRAFEEEKPFSEIVREALRDHLAL